MEKNMDDMTEELVQDMDMKPEVVEQIKKKVKELREKNPEVRAIFPIVVDGDEFDEKEMYIGYFRQPSFKTFSKYLSAIQGNQAVAMRTLATECFLDGDKELIDDDSLFIFGLMGQLGKIIEMRHSKLVNLSKPGK